MNYVFRFVGVADDPERANENRFYSHVDNGSIYTVRGGYHAPKFSSEVIDIEKMNDKLGKNYRAELWTPALLHEEFHKTAPKGWWIAPLLIFGLPTVLGLAIWFMTRH